MYILEVETKKGKQMKFQTRDLYHARKIVLKFFPLKGLTDLQRRQTENLRKSIETAFEQMREMGIGNFTMGIDWISFKIKKL